MTGNGHDTPARTRRAFFVLALVTAAISPAMWAQKMYRPQPGYVQLGKPDQAEGRRIIDEFRANGAMGIAGDYYLELELRLLPRSGPERSLAGRMWGGRNDQGTVERVVLGDDRAGSRLLVQNGPQGAVWNSGGLPAGSVGMLGIAALFTPLAETELTAFDLQMPYLYWPDFIYEGIAKIRGRPAYQFLLYPPAEFAAKYPALTGVRIYLDTEFRQPVQSEQIGEGGRLLKTMMVQELQKTGEQWIPKSVDWRNDVTRNKTRLNVTGAALSQHFAPDIFAPAALNDDVQPPAQVGRIEP